MDKTEVYREAIRQYGRNNQTETDIIVHLDDYIKSNLWQLFPVINVDKVKDIPCDYPGVMAVPITLMARFNGEQFRLLGITKGNARLENGRVPYKRLLIRHLKPKLPPEFNLSEWLRKCNIDCCFMSKKQEK